MADSLGRFAEDVRALRVSVDALTAEIRRVCPPALGQVAPPIVGSPADVMARFFSSLPEATPTAAAERGSLPCAGRCRMADPSEPGNFSTFSTKVLGVEVLRVFGLPTQRALSASLEMPPRGELPVLTVRYLVHGDDVTASLVEVLKTWRVVPEDEASGVGSPDAAVRPPAL